MGVVRPPTRTVDRRFNPIAEDDEETRRKEKVYVAVGKKVDKSIPLLQWAIQSCRRSGSEICLLHVHQPSPFIPTLLGKLPASQANRGVVAAYRREEKEKMNNLLLNYLTICYNAKVAASICVTEGELVHKALVDKITKRGIQKLVMGSLPHNCVKVKKSSGKANYAVKHAPLFCEIWFIHKGKHVWTREAFDRAIVDSSNNVNNCAEEGLGSKSFRYSKRERLYNPEHIQFSSSRFSVQYSMVKDWAQSEHCEEDLLLPRTLRASVSSYDHSYDRSSMGDESVSSASIGRKLSSFSDSKSEEENLCGLLLEAKVDAERSRIEAFTELSKRKHLEAEAMQTIRKMNDIESSCKREAGLRKVAENALTSMVQEQETLVEERLELTGELQKTMRNVAVLDNRVKEANHRCDEAVEELKLIQSCAASLRDEKHKIQRQKIEAELWLDKWRSRRLVGTKRNGHSRFLDDVPELVEFSLLDLQTATCNFSESFKVLDGANGCIYKGELLDRTVAIQKLHAHNIQGPSQFQQEVQVLGKIRHRHLVNLIGTCSEAWSLVYDYVPNGTLQSRLFSKSNIRPLSWKIRARMIYEISTALLFLHSSYPEKIIHGDLKLENILLDSELHCKICDFGISRLLAGETLRCPSFRHYPEPKGAFPYADPEFHRTGKLSPKSDVYSFGVIMLQLLTGHPPVGLVANVRKAKSGENLASLLDSSAGDWGPFVAEKLVDMALRFCEPNSRDRPPLTPSLVKELQQLHTSEERAVPSFFVCPILQEIMCDPLVAADGFTYEREAIRKWLENGRETSPMTNLRLEHLLLTPNHALRLAIQEWLCKL